MSKTRTFGDLALQRADCDRMVIFLGAGALARLTGLGGYARGGQQSGVTALTSANDAQDQLEGVQTQLAA